MKELLEANKIWEASFYIHLYQPNLKKLWKMLSNSSKRALLKVLAYRSFPVPELHALQLVFDFLDTLQKLSPPSWKAFSLNRVNLSNLYPYRSCRTNPSELFSNLSACITKRFKLDQQHQRSERKQLQRAVNNALLQYYQPLFDQSGLPPEYCAKIFICCYVFQDPVDSRALKKFFDEKRNRSRSRSASPKRE